MKLGDDFQVCGWYYEIWGRSSGKFLFSISTCVEFKASNILAYKLFLCVCDYNTQKTLWYIAKKKSIYKRYLSIKYWGDLLGWWEVEQSNAKVPCTLHHTTGWLRWWWWWWWWWWQWWRTLSHIDTQKHLYGKKCLWEFGLAP